MSEDTTADTSLPPTNSDATKAASGNKSIRQAEQILLQQWKARQEAADAQPGETPPSEAVAKKEETPPTEPAKEETPPAEEGIDGEPEAEKAESTDKTEESADDAGEDVLSKFESLPDDVKAALRSELEERQKRIQEKIDKRIGKEVAKKKQLEAALEETRQQLEQLKATTPEKEVVVAQPPNPNDPLADVVDEAALKARVQEAREAKWWAESQLDRDDLEDNPPVVNGKQLTKAEVKAIMRNAERLLEVHVPTRQEWLKQAQEAKSAARQQFKWWNDPSSPEYQLAKAEMRKRPNLAASADGELTISYLVEGMMSAKKAAEPKKAKPEVKAKPAAKAPSDQAATSAVGSFVSRDSSAKLQEKAEEANRAAIKAKGNLSYRDAIKLLYRKP